MEFSMYIHKWTQWDICINAKGIFIYSNINLGNLDKDLFVEVL